MNSSQIVAMLRLLGEVQQLRIREPRAKSLRTLQVLRMMRRELDRAIDSAEDLVLIEEGHADRRREGMFD